MPLQLGSDEWHSNEILLQILYSLALEALLSTEGGAEICVTIPTSGQLRSPDPLLVIATLIIMRIMHFTSVKATWRLLDKLKLFSSTEVTNMRPAKDFPEAREHLGETSTLELSFSRIIFTMRHQKLSPRLSHARITQESYKPIVQAFLSVLGFTSSSIVS